jgi:oxygen-independent coproporphyrinogen-3 oxidase
MLLMGLRLADGIDPARFAARTGMAWREAVDADVLAQGIDEGYISIASDRIAATAEGRLRLDALLAALVL